MPRDLFSEKTQAEKELEEMISGRKDASEKEISETATVGAEARRRFSEGTSELAKRVAGRYGSGGVEGFEASVDPFLEDLRRMEEESLSFRKSKELRKASGQEFEFLVNRMVNAGLDRGKAEEVAMQFALDEDRRRGLSAEAERERQLALKKQDVIDYYSERQIQLAKQAAERERVNMFKNAIYKSLFIGVGIAAGVATAGASAPLSAKLIAAGVGATAGGAVSDIVGSGTTLRQKSGFVPRR